MFEFGTVYFATSIVTSAMGLSLLRFRERVNEWNPRRAYGSSALLSFLSFRFALLGDRTDSLSCHRLSSLCMCIGVIQAIGSYVQNERNVYCSVLLPLTDSPCSELNVGITKVGSHSAGGRTRLSPQITCNPPWPCSLLLHRYESTPYYPSPGRNNIIAR